MRITLGNRPFCIYLVAQIVMIRGSTMIWPARPYIAHGLQRFIEVVPIDARRHAIPHGTLFCIDNKFRH